MLLFMPLHASRGRTSSRWRKWLTSDREKVVVGGVAIIYFVIKKKAKKMGTHRVRSRMFCLFNDKCEICTSHSRRMTNLTSDKERRKSPNRCVLSLARRLFALNILKQQTGAFTHGNKVNERPKHYARNASGAMSVQRGEGRTETPGNTRGCGQS